MRSFISEIISFRSRNPNEIFVPGSKQQDGGFLFLPNEQVGEIKQEKFSPVSNGWYSCEFALDSKEVAFTLLKTYASILLFEIIKSRKLYRNFHV